MQKNIAFKIVKFNKKLQKKINININDYKNFYEIYASTKVEIIPIKDKYGKFINVKEDDKMYFHIYFNDRKEEIKNKYSINEKDEVTKIKIIIDYKVNSLSGLFDGCNCIESIDYKKYCRKKEPIGRIFRGCLTLKELTLSNFYNNEIKGMCSTFHDFPSLQKINLSNFYNNKAYNMNSTFWKCPLLKEININNFYNNYAENMNSTFWELKAFKELNASNFYNNEGDNMNSTFRGCPSLQKINISNFVNNKGDNMNSTFNNCSSLKELNISKCRNNQTDIFSSFEGCSNELKINNIPLNMYNGDLTLKKNKK